MERKGDDDWVKAYSKLVMEGTVGTPKKTWQNTISADMRLLGVDSRDAKALVKLRATRRLKVL